PRSGGGRPRRRRGAPAARRHVLGRALRADHGSVRAPLGPRAARPRRAARGGPAGGYRALQRELIALTRSLASSSWLISQAQSPRRCFPAAKWARSATPWGSM